MSRTFGWKKILSISLLTCMILVLNSCGPANTEEGVSKKDWFEQAEGLKQIKKAVTVNGVTIIIERIKEKKEGVEIWWRASSEITNKISPNPNASFSMGFDPAPVVEITGQKGTGMMVYDRFNQLHLADSDEVKHTPTGKTSYTGFAFFSDIGIVDVNKIVILDAILDIPTEVEFKVNLPPNFQGSLPLNMVSEVRDGKVILRNVKISPEDTKVSLAVESNPEAALQLVELSGLTIYGQKYYAFKEAVGDEFEFVPLGPERDYVIKVWKASYRVNGPWEWLIKQ